MKRYVRLADKWRNTTGSTLQLKPTAWAPLWGIQAVFCVLISDVTTIEEERR